MPGKMTHAVLLNLVTFMNTPASRADAVDTRQSLGPTDAEQIAFLAEMRQMRQMLASIQGIVAGIDTEDREAIAAAARLSGNRMARATPAPVRAKLPQALEEIGGPTHLLFEETAIRAETEDMADLAILTDSTLEQCAACHTRFRGD